MNPERLTERLKKLIEEGAEIYLSAHLPIGPLDTAALISDDCLFFCYPEENIDHWEHFIEFDEVKDDGYYLSLYLKGRHRATIYPIEDPENRRYLEQWRASGHKPSDYEEHIAILKKFANRHK